MKKLFFPFMLLACVLITACGDDDDLKYINPDRLSGVWYLTNIRGWEYDDDAHHNKSHFNETYNYNGQGIPVDNILDAQKVDITVTTYDEQLGIYFLNIYSYYWSTYNREWAVNQRGSIKLQGNQLIDGTMKATITKLTDTTLTTYQKDDEGETYITYTRL